jgi:hypothetical protein
MGSDSHHEAYHTAEPECDDAQHARLPHSGEGAASALATMREQFDKHRRDCGMAADEALPGRAS